MSFIRAQNIPSNAILPFDPRKYMLALGSVEYVIIEVLISKLIRMLLGVDNKGWIELGAVHAISLTYMGGAQGLVDAPGALDDTFLQQLIDGGKGIPAVFMAQFTWDTAQKGFHAPFVSWTIEDTLISAASKALSRPLFGIIYPYVKGTTYFGETLDLVNEMIGRQKSASTLARFFGASTRKSGI